jgi:hypothetical protein
MSDWISVDVGLPRDSSHVLVFCDGGNIAMSFFVLDRELAKSYHSGRGYSRKRSNKQSCHFDIAHNYSYKITHWMPKPPPPKSVK